MKIKLHRKYRKDTYSIGLLYVDGKYFCDTCEDKDRGLKQTDPLAKIKAVKVYAETAIPIGTYKVAMDVVSPKFAAVAWYKTLCGGKMPRIMNVPGYEGVLIHPGSNALDSAGCILVGRNKVRGGLIQSRVTFAELYAKMLAAHKRGEDITLEIVW